MQSSMLENQIQILSVPNSEKVGNQIQIFLVQNSEKASREVFEKNLEGHLKWKQKEYFIFIFYVQVPYSLFQIPSFTSP